MKNIYKLILIVLVLSNFSFAQKITGLSNWTLFLDPGHSQKENKGVFNFPEADRNLVVSLHVRDWLLANTDIKAVHMSRTDDQVLVGLGQRSEMANALGVSHFHSFHSDASGTAGTNSALLLWGMYKNGTEKIPNGGKKMSDPMIDLLVRSMRNTGKSWGDCEFYGSGCTYGPYLSVNSNTNMPSELSESGFHTNPTQNQLNMSSDYLRFESYAFVWSILKYHNIARPAIRSVAGIIKDNVKNKPLNGAVVTILDRKDTTGIDAKPQAEIDPTNMYNLSNGFYFIDNLPAGTHNISISAPGFATYTGSVTVSDTFHVFHDVTLLSTLAPTASVVSPANDTLDPKINSLVIDFNMEMNKASVESNLSISPAVNAPYVWQSSDKRLIISTENFNYSTAYTVTIGGNAFGLNNVKLDGNSDGTGGDDFVHTIHTLPKGVKVVKFIPQGDSLYPGLSNLEVTFHRSMNKASVTSNISFNPAAAATYAWSVNDTKLTINTSQLAFDTQYQLVINGAAVDIYNNPLDGNGDGTEGDNFVGTFKTKVKEASIPQIEDVVYNAQGSFFDLRPIITIVFSEPITASTLTGKYSFTRTSDNTKVTATGKYLKIFEKGIISFFFKNDLTPNSEYRIAIEDSIKDEFGNLSEDTFVGTFTTPAAGVTSTDLETFESAANFSNPRTSVNSIGIIADSSSSLQNSIVFSQSTAGTKSLQIKSFWDVTKTDWLIDVSNTNSVTAAFGNNRVIQTSVFGDGNSNLLRFVFTETPTSKEVSKWIPIDWYGWKKVVFDLSKDTLGTWSGQGGDGSLAASLKLGGLQIKRANTPLNEKVELYFDDIRVLTVPLSVEENKTETIVNNFALEQNYPNPFNPSTVIGYNMPSEGFVTLDVYNSLGEKVTNLVNDFRSKGHYSIVFEAGKHGLTSGIYFYKINVASKSGNFTETKKLMLVK